jgi:hypothetical protein
MHQARSSTPPAAEHSRSALLTHQEADREHSNDIVSLLPPELRSKFDARNDILQGSLTQLRLKLLKIEVELADQMDW